MKSFFGSSPLGSALSSLGPSATEVDTEPVIYTNAAELAAAYEENAVAADQRFGHGKLRVNGTVKDIGKNIANQAYVVLSENAQGWQGVQAMFESDAGLARLTKGDRDSVVCASNSGKILYVILRGCVLAP